MSRLTDEQIRHLARLAALDVPEEEVPALAAQIAGILAYVSQLQTVDTDAAYDGQEAAGAHGLRPDVPRASSLRFPLGRGAPALHEGLFVVPRVPGLDDA